MRVSFRVVCEEMASGLRERDLRRRPVRGGETAEDEVEISEIAEDEEEEGYDDDPMVLKGSRPTVPPGELAEGTEVSVCVC